MKYWVILAVYLCACDDGGSSTGPSPCDELAEKIRTTAEKDQALIEQGRSQNPCASPIPIGSAGNYAKACENLKACLDENK